MTKHQSGRKANRSDLGPVRHVLIPALLTALSVSAIVYLLDTLSFDLKFGIGSSAIIFASFGSSAFILFMMPRVSAARLWRFSNSYFMAGVIGAVGYFLLAYLPLYAVAGVTMLLLAVLMRLTDNMHPPAMSIALAFVIYHIQFYGIAVVVAGVLLLVMLRVFLERFVFVLEEEIAEEFNKI